MSSFSKFFYCFFLLLSFISIRLFAQAPAIQWQKAFGGSNNDEAYSLDLTNDSGYVIAGSTMSSDGNVTANKGGKDCWIIKIDKSGNLQWQKNFGGSRDDEAKSIKQTFDGGYIIAGNTSSNDGDVSANNGKTDFWVVKIDHLGNLQWQKTFGGSEDDQANSILQTTDSGYIVAGYSMSKNGDVTKNKGGQDYWILKLNNSGSLQWQKNYGGSGHDFAFSVTQNNQNNYVIAGRSSSTDGDITRNYSQNGYDCWLISINNVGNIQWQKNYGGNLTDVATSIKYTPDGGYITGGYSYSYDFDLTANYGVDDFWVFKIDKSGNVQWQKNYGGLYFDYAESVDNLFDGGYIIAGGSYSPNVDVSKHYGSVNVPDYWIIKLSNTGKLEWEKNLGGNGTDEAHFIRQTLDSGYIVVGSSGSNDSDVSNNHGGMDFWIVKLGEPICTPSIIVSQPIPVCLGASGTFTTKITDGGITPHYKWKVNGSNVGNDSISYSTSNLKNGDSVTCTLTSNAACAVANSIITSTPIKVNIVSQFPPIISVNNDTCSGSTLTVKSNELPSSIVWTVNNTTVSTQNASLQSNAITVAGGNGAGNALNQLNNPDRMFVDAAGNMYIPDLTNNRVVKWAKGATSGVVIAGGNGQGGGANQFDRPTGVYVDKNGVLYVADQTNGRVQKWLSGATSGITVARYLSSPTAVFVDDNLNMYVSEQNASRVTKWAPGALTGTTVAGNGNYGSALNQLSTPTGIYVDAAGNVYVCDTDNDRVVKWAPGATSGTVVAGGNGQGYAPNQLTYPLSVYVDAGGSMYISDFYNYRVQKWMPGATYGTTVAGGNGQGNAANQLYMPIGAFVDAEGSIYVADFYNHRVQKFAYTVPYSYKPITVGKHIVTVTNMFGCAATDSVTIVPYHTPGITITSNPASICPGKQVTFTALPADGGNAPSYQWKLNGTAAGTDSSAFVISTLKDGDAVTCTLKSNAAYCLTSTTAVSNTLVMKLKAPPVLAGITGTNNVCINASATLANTTSAGIWSSADPSIANVNAAGIVTGFKNGNTVINYSLSDGCVTVTKSHPLTVNALPAIQQVAINYELCGKHLATVSVQSLSSILFTINGGNTQNTSTFTGLVSGNYVIRTTDGKGCSSDTSLVINQPVTPKPSVGFSMNPPTCFRPLSGSITINASGNESPYVIKSNGKSFTNAGVLSNLSSGSYSFHIFNRNDCPVDTVNLNLVLREDGTCDTLYVPSGFTPNNDTYNDVLKPLGGSLVKEVTFRVFNRYGAVVFESHDVYKGWDGRLNSVPQDAGVYVWLLVYTDRNNRIKTARGTTVLVR